jgi:dTDP-4-amino-4,6-dideoxygalactose transaminase
VKRVLKVPFSYLDRQFADVDAYLADVKALVLSGDFTLGKAVGEFERSFAELCRMPHAVGVGSGTDALILPMKLLGIGPGDEVITAANTFIASVGAIAMTGATPRFVDNDEGFTMDPSKLEAAITPRTKAILAVHYTGNMADMPAIEAVARKHNLLVIEDACQSIGAQRDGKPAGSWSEAAAYSLHPLKNLNVWGDAGVTTTRSDDLAERLRLFRNHGMLNRDEIAFYGHNSRLDSLQAVIGNRLIAETKFITEKRIANARKLDAALSKIPEIRVPARPANVKHVYHLYIVRADRRDDLLRYVRDKGVDAKVHYPIPAHLQKASAHLGYKSGDFPMAESDSANSITFPAHQHLTDGEIDFMISAVREFYGR